MKNKKRKHLNSRSTYQSKRKDYTNHKAIGKIGGCMFLLILIILFVAAHGRNNEMMYVTLLFVFLAIALFSYGYWSAVNRDDGIWQYIGKNNLQHQQVPSSNYNLISSVPNFKGHPRSKMHMVAPPKMGGVRLEIYTLDEESNIGDCDGGGLGGGSNSITSNSGSEHSGYHHHHHHHHHHHGNSGGHHHHHKHHHEVHRLYHQHHQELMIKNSMSSESDCQLPAATDSPRHSTYLENEHSNSSCTKGALQLLPMRAGHSCIELTPTQQAKAEDANDPIHCEVNLSRSESHYYRQHQREGFAEVQLPPLK